MPMHYFLPFAFLTINKERVIADNIPVMTIWAGWYIYDKMHKARLTVWRQRR